MITAYSEGFSSVAFPSDYYREEVTKPPTQSKYGFLIGLGMARFCDDVYLWKWEPRSSSRGTGGWEEPGALGTAGCVRAWHTRAQHGAQMPNLPLQEEEEEEEAKLPPEQGNERGSRRGPLNEAWQVRGGRKSQHSAGRPFTMVIKAALSSSQRWHCSASACATHCAQIVGCISKQAQQANKHANLSKHSLSCRNCRQEWLTGT